MDAQAYHDVVLILELFLLAIFGQSRDFQFQEKVDFPDLFTFSIYLFSDCFDFLQCAAARKLPDVSAIFWPKSEIKAKSKWKPLVTLKKKLKSNQERNRLKMHSFF